VSQALAIRLSHVGVVPVKALALSVLAMAAAIGAAYLWPEVLGEREVLASILAVFPALLVAHYRGWRLVSVLLAVGIVGLCFLHFTELFVGAMFQNSLVLFVVTPYIAIALGAGWFGEVRRYQTQLQSTQLQLIQSEKLDSLGRMAAGIAHEVKNPLMMLLTGVKILSKRLADADEDTRVLLQDMADAVARADRIIGGLLSYSRNRDLDTAIVDLNATIDQSLVLVKHEIDKRHIRVVKDLAEALPPVKLDEFKMQQVFVNLITNALHAMGDDGELRLRTCVETMMRGNGIERRAMDRYAQGERVVVAHIEDSGPGIPREHLERVFDPFFTTKPTGVGTGLGLSVSRQIVEMHGGTIDIGNRETGGARVTTIFKLASTDENNEKTANTARR
jgi:signal transduction histidine kinase